MENTKLVKQYFNKYFKQQYFKESDHEFKSLVRILNKKDKQVKNLNFTHSSLPLKDRYKKGFVEWFEDEKIEVCAENFYLQDDSTLEFEDIIDLYKKENKV